MTDVLAHVLAGCRAVPGWETAELTVEPLHGGITNQNFVVDDGTERRWVVRVPGERTELLGIDREFEAQAAGRAAELGIGPAVRGEFPGLRTLVTELVPGWHLEPSEFVARLGDVVSLLQRFHESGALDGVFPIHRVVEWHARDAAAHGAIVPGAYHRLHDASRRIEAAFAETPEPAVPCHNDLLPANVLFSEHRTWLLDFEYAGMNDRYFDLGNLSVNSSFDTAGDAALLELYFGAPPTPRRSARLQLMKIMSEFREGMWAVVQQAISTLDTDFVRYADERLASCERLAGSCDFGGWLAAAAASD
jgi:thiamine kinase-like enzyme